MNAENLSKVGSRLVKRCGTRDPFSIARQLGIEVLFCENFGPLKGMYRVIKRSRFIFINENLSGRMQRIVCAHELGHDQLHRNLAKGSAIQEFMLYDMTTKPEYEANIVAAEILLDTDEILEYIYDYGYTYDKRGNLVKEEEICSPTTTGPKNITVATYLYDETNRMVQGTNKAGEVSAYTFNGLGVRVGTELILKDNTHGYTDFHCQTPSVETGIEKPEVVKTDYVIDYTRLDIDQRVLMKSEQDGYDFFYTYGLDKLQVMTIGEGSNWWGQSIK